MQGREGRREERKDGRKEGRREQARNVCFFLGSPDEGKFLQLFGNIFKKKGRAVLILRMSRNQFKSSMLFPIAGISPSLQRDDMLALSNLSLSSVAVL